MDGEFGGLLVDGEARREGPAGGLDGAAEVPGGTPGVDQPPGTGLEGVQPVLLDPVEGP